jgi:hypothetical protein
MVNKDALLFNEERFGELVLYIAQRCMGDPEFGATKMAKALWRIDFQAFARFGRPLTGAEYQKLEHGPAARQFLPVLAKLKGQGVAQEAEQEVNGYHSKRVVALRPANIQLFSSEEVMLIESVLEDIRGKTASQLSRESHEFIGWKLAETGETIPYTSLLLPDVPLLPQPTDVEYGQALVQRLGGKA